MQTLAIIIKAEYSKDGVEFFTPDEYSQQLAFMAHKKGKIIPAHVHNAVKREVHFTKEVLLIRKGNLRVDFYDDEKNYLESTILSQGDVTLFTRRMPSESNIASLSDVEKIYDYIRMLDAEGYPHAFLEHNELHLTFTDACLQGETLTAQVTISSKDNNNA